MATAGFMQSHGGGHTSAIWHVRAQPAVHAAFAAIWNTDDLIVSFDTTLAWRPWWLHDEGHQGSATGQDQDGWRPRVERLHCDQNPLHKPGRACVQGMVPLISVSPLVGGLQVVPRSHTAETQQHLVAAYPEAVADAEHDWVELAPDDPYIGRGKLVPANAGDLILWDSRAIHGGLVGAGEAVDVAELEVRRPRECKLARLAMAVCMVPRAHAPPEVLQQRRDAFAKGLTLTHWPNQYVQHWQGDTHAVGIVSSYQPPDVSEWQRALI